MRIESTLPSDLTTPSGGAPAAQAGSKNEFLKLLVAQLTHQDPLSPQDGAEFVAQLAQFTAVEQATETNQRLSALADAQAANQRAALTDIVGRGVTASADTIRLDPSAGEMPDIRAHLDGSASQIEVVIKDDAGNTVRTIKMGAHGAGDVPINWDGTGDQGQPLPAGNYHIEVNATGAGGAPVSASAQVHGRVNSVKFDNGSTSFAMGSVVIQPGAILSVEE